jgi:hypothetical protein
MFYLVGLVCNGGRRFTPAGFSFIPFQLPFSPMRLLAMGLEHALDVAVLRPLMTPIFASIISPRICES